MAGARVSATAHRTELHAAVAELGAGMLDPEELLARGPFDVILELVGAPHMAANLDALAICGRIVVIGVSAGAKFELNLLVLMGKRARVHGSMLRARPLEEKALVSRRFEHEALPAIASGSVRVPLHRAFPLDSAADAYDCFARGGKLGKIVLTM
jgi:NADPH2:quinone reductase